jgi:hypothetical protein
VNGGWSSIAASGKSPLTSQNERSMARFLESWYKDAGLYECRGTSELSDWYPSHGAVTFKMRSGAVSRYKLITKPGIYHGTESKLRALALSPGGTIKGSRYKKAVNSKTVTNK